MASSSGSGSAIPIGFQIHHKDNVATLLEAAEPGPLLIRGPLEEETLMLREPIDLGHKVAIRLIDAGETVVKYGVVIGIATVQVQAGSWIHLHNCRSRLDERSGAFDLHTGLPEDTRYE